MSQAAFAAFLGADASTVQSWEQDLRPPSPLACRMLSEIEADATHWRKRLAACLIGPESAGRPHRPRRAAADTRAPGPSGGRGDDDGRRCFAGNPHPPGPPCRDLGARPVPRGRVGHRPEHRGHQQAEQLGRWLKDADPRALYCSAMRRAVDTAAPIGRACGLEPVVIAALHERRIGPLSGVSREEGWATYAETKRRWIAGELEVAHPGGESFADIRRRVGPILEELAARHRGETIVVVAHGVVIRVALTSLLAGFSPADFDRIAIDFASVNDLWCDGRTWTARALNQVVAPSPSRPVA